MTQIDDEDTHVDEQHPRIGQSSWAAWLGVAIVAAVAVGTLLLAPRRR